MSPAMRRRALEILDAARSDLDQVAAHDQDCVRAHYGVGQPPLPRRSGEVPTTDAEAEDMARREQEH